MPSSIDSTSSGSKPALLSIATLAILVYGMIASVAGAIIPQLSARTHITAAQIGTLFLLQAVGMMAASLSAGPLVDVKGKKAGLLTALLLIVIALLGLPNSGSYIGMLGCMALLGVGGGGLTTSASALLSDINPARRATILTLTKASYGIGGFITPMIGATLLAGNTIALCYVISVLALLLSAALSMVRFPPPSTRRGFSLKAAGPLLSEPLLYLLSLTLFFYVACEVGMFNWLPKYLIARGLPEAQALRIVSLGFALGLLGGRIAFAFVLMKVSARTVTVAAAIGMTLTTGAIMNMDSPASIGMLAFGAGLAMAPVFPSVVAIIGDRYPQLTATAMGIAITSGWAGLAVSSRLIGAVAGRASAGVVTGFLVLPVFSLVLVILSIALWFRLQPASRATEVRAEFESSSVPARDVS